MADPKLNVKISADNKELNRGLQDSQKKIGGFEGMVKKAGMALVGAFAARQVFKGLKDLTMGLANTADRLLDLEQITGITTDTLQEYEYVAKIAGVNTEALANASMGLTQRLARATTESSPLNIALKQLGVNAKDAGGELRNGGDIMDDVINQLAEMENVTERNVLGSQIFAGAWKDMAPVLSMGADGIAQVREEARELGIVMDKEALEKANEFRVSMERLSTQSQALKQDIGLMLIPIFTDLADTVFETTTKFKDFLQTNREVMSAVAADTELNFMQKSWAALGRVFGRTTKAAQDATRRQSELRKQRMMEMDAEIEQYIAMGHIDSDITQGMIQNRNEFAKAYGEELKFLDSINDKWKEQTQAVQGVNNELDEQVRRLGDIERIEDEIGKLKQQYIQSNSALERAAHLQRLRQLEEERERIEEAANILATLMGAGNLGAPQSVKPIGPAGRDGQGLGIALNDDIGEFKELSSIIDDTADALINWQEVGVQAAASIGMGMMDMAKDGKKAVGQMIKQTMAQVVAHLIAKIVSSPALPFPSNLLVAAGAGAMAGGLMGQIPAFADGGMVKSPTMAMFGEYAGARTNPEYALRQDQLAGVIRQAGTNVSGEFKIRGQDLVASLKEAQRRNKAY